jgi:hypothetical protein
MTDDTAQLASMLVARDRLEDGTEISTVRLHFMNLELDGAPFETCVFYPNGHSTVVARWPNMKEARWRHRGIVDHEEQHRLVRERRMNC